MANGAIEFEDAAPVRLLFVETQFGVAFERRIAGACGHRQQHDSQKDGRYSLQVTIIMFWIAISGKCPRAIMPVVVKRAYEKPSTADGQRILVDRLWPRGITKDAAKIDHWLKGLAPSTELRKWFHANGDWPLFKKRYFQELSAPEAAADLEQLYHIRNKHRAVTLVYSSRDPEHNNAVALKELLEGMRKPPSSSGPASATAVSGRTAKRRQS
jgi:uncharacterized protein YeaO (DUF488 family)